MPGEFFLQATQTAVRKGVANRSVQVLPLHSPVQYSKGHIFVQGRHEELVVRILEDHPHFPPDLPEILLPHLEILDVDVSPLELKETDDAEHERRLARAGGAHEGNRFVRCDRERNVFDCAGTVRVFVGSVSNVQCGRGHGFRIHPPSRFAIGLILKATQPVVTRTRKTVSERYQ